MKKAIAVIAMITMLLTGYVVTAAAAQEPAGMKQSQRDFIAKVGVMAAADMKKSGVLASLTMAQAILESGWGTSDLATKANALFGIKADHRWSGPTYTKVTQELTGPVIAAFRSYGSWQESMNDHSTFLATGTRYAAVIGEKNYKQACRAIHKAGYATALDYADRLIKLIETYGLMEYDKESAPGASTADTPAPNSPAPTRPALTENQKKAIAAYLKALFCGK